MVGDFPELNCRRVAVAVHGEGDFQGFTPLAIHCRRVEAKANAIDGRAGLMGYVLWGWCTDHRYVFCSERCVSLRVVASIDARCLG